MCKPPEALMLFSAGFGTRMGALTAACPKPLINVAGKPLIDHALEIVDAAGINTVVANTHYLPDLLKEHLADRNVSISHEQKIMETGGGLRHALPLLNSNPVFTFNTDAVWTGQNPLSTLAASWDPDKMDALLLLVSPKDAYGYQGDGDFQLSESGGISRGAGMVYSGAQIIKTERLAEFPESVFSLNLLWDKMIANNRVFGTPHIGNWCDVGTPAGIKAAEKMLEYKDV